MNGIPSFFMYKLLVSALVAFLPGAAFAAFSDVSPSYQYANSIQYVQDRGYVIGYADGTYQPEASINRAEFVKILRGVRKARIEAYQNAHPDAPKWEDGYCITAFGDASIGLPFSDVDEAAWYAPDVCFAVSQRLVDGYPDATFRPGKSVNFSEAAKIVANVFDVQTEPDLQVWYKPYVEALSVRGAVPASVPSVASFITRGEMAYMIERMERGKIASSASSSAASGFVTIISPADSSASSTSSASRASSQASSSPEPEIFLGGYFDGESSVVKKGDVIQLVFTAFNEGPGTAQNVTFGMTLSNKSDFIAAQSDPRCRTNSSSIYNVVCTIGNMQPQTDTEFRIALKTTQFLCPNTLTYGGSLDADNENAKKSIKFRSVQVKLECPEPEKPELSPEIVYMEMYPGVEPVVLDYYVNNTGTVAAQNVYAFITIPSGLTVVPSGTTGGCSQSPGLLTCNLGTVQASSSAHVQVTYAPGCINNRFTTEMSMQTSTPTKYPLNPLDVEFIVYCVEE